ncbi:uncharacterized protein [Spinacia oleracea]|uniref:Uncharacterized protein isoform X2 n=1 Tax=Spinacia oleracea TaxID=3562 RepID=A0ABM3QK48_SPIOL|nr:uncharacterized protein LOC130460094 isoform X2 [Spinacia oleracea]
MIMGYSDGGCDPVLSSFEGHERDNNSGGGGGGGGGGGHASDSDTNSELNNDNVTAPPAAKRLKTTATISQAISLLFELLPPPKIKLKLRGAERLISIMGTPQPANNSKAINFSALSLQIGSWKFNAMRDGDLVVKCFFKAKKMAWEVCLFDGIGPKRKAKIEFDSSNIQDMDIFVPENSPGYLRIKMKGSPSFFFEVDPQPRKHTKWQATTEDFTDNQASQASSVHVVKCKAGVLEKNYVKLKTAYPVKKFRELPLPTLNQDYQLLVGSVVIGAEHGRENPCSIPRNNN